MTRCLCCCAALLFVVGNVALPDEEVEELRDEPYGEDPLQRLDLYLPAERAGRLPAVIWIHGGGWREGDKRLDPNGIGELATILPRQGFIAVSINYRLGPRNRHPAQIDDVQRAVRWLRANAATYQIDPDRIGAAGISAGGHLAAMLAVRETREPAGDELDEFSSRVQTVVAINAPTDLRDTPALAQPILMTVLPTLFGSDLKSAAAAREDASPIRFVDQQSSPILFIVGSRDRLVPPDHSKLMAEELVRHGVETDVLVVPDGGHSLFPDLVPEVQASLVNWFEKQLSPPAGKIGR